MARAHAQTYILKCMHTDECPPMETPGKTQEQEFVLTYCSVRSCILPSVPEEDCEHAAEKPAPLSKPAGTRNHLSARLLALAEHDLLLLLDLV